MTLSPPSFARANGINLAPAREELRPFAWKLETTVQLMNGRHPLWRPENGRPAYLHLHDEQSPVLRRQWME